MSTTSPWVAARANLPYAAKARVEPTLGDRIPADRELPLEHARFRSFDEPCLRCGHKADEHIPSETRTRIGYLGCPKARS